MTGVVSKQTLEKFTSTAELEGKFSGKSRTIVEIFVLELIKEHAFSDHIP